MNTSTMSSVSQTLSRASLRQSFELKAAVLYGAKDIRIEDIQTPKPRPGEALVRIMAAGICGSDLHYFLEGRSGMFKPVEPFVLGHEFAGSIEHSDAEGFREDNRVVIEPGIPCFKCYYCRRGRYNLCSSLRFVGTAASIPHINGGFAEYCSVPVEGLHKIPEGLGFEDAALAEPLSVAIHACNRSGVEIGDRVMILGAGPIGLLTTVVIMLSGSADPIVIDKVERRLKVAADIGAHSINFQKSDVLEEAKCLTGGQGMDIVFEASGSPSALSLAIKAARRGGRIVLIGNLPDEEISTRLASIVPKELDVRGVFRYANTFDAAITLLSRKLIPTSKIITHRFGLKDIHEAFSAALGGNALKVLLAP